VEEPRKLQTEATSTISYVEPS